MLVVDDDALQLRAIERTLKRFESVELRVADNAIDAMLAIGEQKPDVIVMDVYMPGLDGIEACRRIKAHPAGRDVKVILASCGPTHELEAAARTAGAESMLSKPLDLVSLLALDQRSSARPLASGTIAPPLGEATAIVAPPSIRGADLLVQMLEDAGVEVVFGLPGGAISPIHDALLDSKIRSITTRHEAGAMFAAAAHARASGTLGVVAVTSGPGVLNSMTGLGTAWCDGTPLLLLVGEVARPAHGKGVLQDGSAHGLQIVEIARHVTKLSLEVPRPSALPHLLRRAITTALSGRQGPVMMTLPLDVTTSTMAPPSLAGTMSMAAAIEPTQLQAIADVIGRARRPLILAGAGIRGGDAPAQLIAVAEHLGCAVATTPKGKGVFPEGHPLALGVLGLGGHPSAIGYLDGGCDVLIAIGTSLGDLSTNGFSPALQTETLIHVDIDARQVGKSYSPTHAVVASAADFLRDLLPRLGARPPVAPAVTGVRRHAIASSTRVGRIASHDAVERLQAMLPADTIYTVDSGEHFMFATHFLQIEHPDSFLVMTGLGSMGQSIGAALGAQLARPERTVAAIVGDGCFAMNAFEIATAVQERLPIRVFVFNDERLGMVEDGHRTVYGRHPDFNTAPLNVCLVARGLGATTVRVETLAQLEAARELLATTPGPVVIDVAIDGDVRLPKIDRVAAMKAAPTVNAFGVEAKARLVN